MNDKNKEIREKDENPVRGETSVMDSGIHQHEYIVDNEIDASADKTNIVAQKKIETNRYYPEPDAKKGEGY